MDRSALGLGTGIGALMAVTLWWSAAGSAPADAAGRSQSGGPAHPARPVQIVSATLASDEILLEILGPERLAAVSRLADDPLISNVAEQASAVAGRVRGDAETILACDPDLVFLARFVAPEAVALLAASGVPVVSLPAFDSIAGVRGLIRRVGSAVGEPARAVALVEVMDRRLAAVAGRVAGAERPRVLFLDAGSFTAGAGTLVDELIQRAGARNAAAEAGYSGSARLTGAAALRLDPDFILRPAYGGGRARSLQGAGLEKDPLWGRLAAVRAGRILTIPGRTLLSIDHHLAAAVEELARRLHPERFKEQEP